MQEKLKVNEGEAQRYRSELQSEKESSFRRHQDLESDRIKLRTDHAIMEEKLKQARFEIDDLRVRMNSEYSEKLQDLEV